MIKYVADIDTIDAFTHSESKLLLNTLKRKNKRLTSRRELAKVIKKDRNYISYLQSCKDYPSQEVIIDIQSMEKKYKFISQTDEWKNLINCHDIVKRCKLLEDSNLLNDDMKDILNKYYLRQNQYIIDLNRYNSFYEEYNNFISEHVKEILILRKISVIEKQIKELEEFAINNSKIRR